MAMVIPDNKKVWLVLKELLESGKIEIVPRPSFVHDEGPKNVRSSVLGLKRGDDP
jgi:hypothetical protein